MRSYRFQYQPLHEGLPAPSARAATSPSFQYQPLHEGLRGCAGRDDRGYISIPAPPRGASIFGAVGNMDYAFQYQPLHEGLQCLPKMHIFDSISIPAPPRGASDGKSRRVRNIDFNTSPSTRGFPARRSSRCHPYFNTSPSTRGFQAVACKVIVMDISIPAPPRGASIRHRVLLKFA